MASFRVRFKGLLNRSERIRLADAGIRLEREESSAVGGIPGTGRPVYTVTIEATSPEEALAAVREALDPDAGNFSNWQVEPA